MKWYKLKSNKCPSCDSKLDPTSNGGMIYCPNLITCGFKISEAKFAEISAQQSEKYRSKGHDNDLSGNSWSRFNE